MAQTTSIYNFQKPDGKEGRKSLLSITPDVIVTCVQKSEWMNDHTTELWFENICNPYIGANAQGFFVNSWKEIFTCVAVVSSVCTIVVHHCDVGVNKPFNSRLQFKYSKCKSNQCAPTDASGKIQSPGRKQVIQWLLEVCNEIPSTF